MNENQARLHRLRVSIRGAVQGVGFRPFVYRLAADLQLAGWVVNSSSGVTVEVEGTRPCLEQFQRRLHSDHPPRAVIHGTEASYLEPLGFDRFEIRQSLDGDKRAVILPDIATCPDCLRDLFDAGNRRFRYPFTNCTNCGPRFTIIEGLPYDRPNTTMAGFEMCEACRAEYDDPLDRRFHAQPNACPACGPRLELWDRAGRVSAREADAMGEAVRAVRDGGILALKGLGGFHLIVDAANDAAVRRLRQVKAREEKPFAVMVPGLAGATAACEVDDLEARLLSSPEAPIVLLRKRAETGLAAAIAPGNPCLGVMLPYTPAHHLLLAGLGRPIVATSGNRADEPICTDEREALARLSGLADVFLVHDRPIARHADDSLVRVLLGRELVLRRARGYAPMPIRVADGSGPVLAVGAHLKNSIALSVGGNAFLSQHVGDLDTPEAYEAFERVIGAFQTMYEAQPTTVACDLHPDYLSTAYARRSGCPVAAVQHHVAHVLACMAENELTPPVLGVAWDGTGFGLDGTIWGGEFFAVRDAVRRVATFRPFGLPGGDRAVREPRRSALAVLFEAYGPSVLEAEDLAPLRGLSPAERQVLSRMLAGGINTPRTSSVGRLFDAVASILGLRQRVRYEGQAAMELEFAVAPAGTACPYPFDVLPPSPGTTLGIVDWRPMLTALVDDVRAGEPAALVAGRFHRTLAEVVVAVARGVGIERIVLSGGCFQNRCLTEGVVSRLQGEGFRPYWHQRVPPNDGGIALGQLAAVLSGLDGAVVR